MSIFKMIDRIEQRFMTGNKLSGITNNWTKLKANFGDNKSHKGGTHALNVIGVHERNGTRGNGMGMGHRNKPKQN
jgi:hypothetical protein